MMRTPKNGVILSKRSASKDLRTEFLLRNNDTAKISPRGFALVEMTKGGRIPTVVSLPRNDGEKRIPKCEDLSTRLRLGRDDKLNCTRY